MEYPNLPQEILLEIFSKLPTKSVGKCRTLSKSWKTDLSTTNFIKKHLMHRKQTIQQESLAIVTQENSVCIITRNDEVFDSTSFPDEWFSVLGSCNGLVLLGGSGTLLLVNPITFKQVTIPFPLLNPFCNSMVFGFGYDCCSNDYKIVALSIVLSTKVETLVQVYSLKNGVWKSLDGCYPYGELVPSTYEFEGGAFLNGAVHWLISSKEGYRSCIAAFDLANEIFREIPLPKEFVRQPGNIEASFSRRRTYVVYVVGGCLLIVDNYGDGATDVWVLKEYGVVESWVRFHIEATDDRGDIVAALCFVEDGELLCLTGFGYMFTCDLKRGTGRKVVLGGHDTWFTNGMAFVSSLVFPEGSS